LCCTCSRILLGGLLGCEVGYDSHSRGTQIVRHFRSNTEQTYIRRLTQKTFAVYSGLSQHRDASVCEETGGICCMVRPSQTDTPLCACSAKEAARNSCCGGVVRESRTCVLLVAVPFVRCGCRHVLLFRWKIGGGCSWAEPLGVSVREGSVNAADAPRLLADGSIYVLAEPRNAARFLWT